MSDVEVTTWPEGYGPPPEGWVWELEDVVCGHCGATNQLHKQPQAWLDHSAGVVWECNACSGQNRLGGYDPLVPFMAVLECGECHSTFTGGEGSALQQSDVAVDGTWTCPICDTPNRLVAMTETATSGEGGTA